MLSHLSEGKYHEQIRIADSSTGFSYESLFKPYIRDGLTEVWVEDPYVRHVHQVETTVTLLDLGVNKMLKYKRTVLQSETHYKCFALQLYNFLRFCEMLLKCPCKVKTIHLLTSQDEVKFYHILHQWYNLFDMH